MNIDKQLKKILGAHSKRTTPNSLAGMKNTRRPLTFDFNFKQPNFNMTNNLLKKFNLKTFGGKNDWDGDGILNKKDCQPRNTMRQDIKGYHGSPKAELIRKEGFKLSERGMISVAPFTMKGKKYSETFTAERNIPLTDETKIELGIPLEKEVFGLGEKTNPKNV